MLVIIACLVHGLLIVGVSLVDNLYILICSYANELRTMESLVGSRKAACRPDGRGDQTETFPEDSHRCCDPRQIKFGFLSFFCRENRPFLMATMASFVFVAVVVLDETFHRVRFDGGCVFSLRRDQLCSQL